MKHRRRKVLPTPHSGMKPSISSQQPEHLDVAQRGKARVLLQRPGGRAMRRRAAAQQRTQRGHAPV